MTRLLRLTLCCLFFATTPLGRSLPPQESGIRQVSLARTVHIAIALLNAQAGDAVMGQESSTLLVSPGAPDESPEGPDSFDVLEDGRVAIADPLRRRIAMFDAQGKFLQAWKIGFAADMVMALPSGSVLVREANTGDVRVFNTAGEAASSGQITVPAPPEARLLSAARGSVQVPSNGGGRGGTIDVRFERPGLRLLSLESLGTDSQGNTYVALETTAGGDTTEGISVQKLVRRYDSAGKPVAEIADIPLDYYVTPLDELRVHNGVVYQLIPTQSEVWINVWIRIDDALSTTS